MSNVSMAPWQVKAARRAVAGGESVKSVARRLRLNYGPVYTAVRGQTWQSITDPPPVRDGVTSLPRKRPLHICQNCGIEYRTGGTTTRCNACYSHWWKYGTERDPDTVHKHLHARLSRTELRRLWQQYQSGLSIEALADNLPFSAETLRRRFIDAGFCLRGNAGTRQKLTPSLVCWARERVHLDGVPVYEVAKEIGVHYMTTYTAVMGHSWRAAGGPLPGAAVEKRPCRVCGMLTGHKGGRCRYCR
jgi:hypothetical protein